MGALSAGRIYLERTQADAREESHPGQPPGQTENAAAHPAAQVQNPPDRQGTFFDFPGHQLIGGVHRRRQGGHTGGPQGAVEDGCAAVFPPPEKTRGVVVVLLLDPQQMACGIQVVHGMSPP
jgi:hypothetical protein